MRTILFARVLSIVFVLIAVVGPPPAWAIDEFEDIKTISELPKSLREVVRAFQRSKSDACEMIPAGESQEITSFKSTLTARDVSQSKKRRMIPASRRNVLTVGLRFDTSDKKSLPLVSRGQITGYLEKHYVGIQARVRRDLLDRELYFHHRPLAVTAQFRGSRLTQTFQPIVSGSIREFHSLGLFRSSESRIVKPQQLRTIVMLFRTEILVPGSRSRSKDSYEFVFVHGIPSDEGDELVPHVFVTTEDRTRLAYMRSAIKPSSPSRCGIVGNIAVTKFDSTGIYPKKSATRSYRLNAGAEFDIADLDAYCESQSLEGGLSNNLPAVLAACVAGEVTPGDE